MKNIKFVLQYEGTRYDGWQKQGNTENTIQGKLEAVLSRLDGREVEVHGSGRTDAGVHAYGQTANAKLETEKSAEEIKEYVNAYLPKDIAVVDAREVSMRFHSRLLAVSKTYRYRIRTGKDREVFSRNFVWHLGKPLDLSAMRMAAEKLVGTHDFLPFSSMKKGKKSTVRTIESITVEQVGEEVHLTFTGDGFLYHMVRILAGTLAEIGLGERSPQEIPEIFDARDRKKAGQMAPAQGLALMQVVYEK
ncbi:MAG TPA: tRNA pseudouridine(38-40) synthase TruA [Candidatus Fimimorpha excrementavium]|nr:tRNA pseudouridine(38-40) synthase TruA [Candidatus Fimimorpha excrementavium]